MEARKLLIPALVFLGGAAIGRIFGFRILARGAMAALAFAGAANSENAARPAPARASRRRVAHRTNRKKPIQKRSHRVTASAAE